MQATFERVDTAEVWRDWLAPAAELERFLEFESLFDDALAAQHAANRALAARMDAARRALALARMRPELLLAPHALGLPDAADLAERAAAADLAMRLRQPEGTVRSWAQQASTAIERLPLVWARFSEGLCGYADLRAALDAVALIDPRDSAGAGELDRLAVELAGLVTTSRLRARLRALVARLTPAAQRHRDAFADRRVVVEAADDGMAWVSLFCSNVDATRIRARLTATAEHDRGQPGETRSADQLRADAAVSWLTGDGTATAVTTEIVVTIPARTLIGDDAPGTLLDGTPVDPATARELFAEAPSFLRLAIDPVTAAPLRLDRTRYRPTRAQRDWLALRYGTCTAPGCSRLADGGDVDHLHDWARGGRTDVENLHPVCRHHHRLKRTASFTVERDDGGTVTWTTPTGYRASADPPPF